MSFKSYSVSGGKRARPAELIPNSGETRADQDAAKYASIDFIIHQFTTKGIPLPETQTSYADFSRVPNNLTDMMSTIDSIYDIFSQLPSNIRAQMNNDIRHYPDFVNSDVGRKQLTELGFIKAQEPAAPKPPEAPAVNNVPSKSSKSKQSPDSDE